MEPPGPAARRPRHEAQPRHEVHGLRADTVEQRALLREAVGRVVAGALPIGGLALLHVLDRGVALGLVGRDVAALELRPDLAPPMRGRAAGAGCPARPLGDRPDRGAAVDED
eukprot:1851453-Lingulodinium_polyedra.AAC.1